MDFTKIIEEAQPIIDFVKSLLVSVGGAGGIIAVIMAIVKTRGNARDIKRAVGNIETNSLQLFKKALPNDLKISIEKLTKEQLNDFIMELQKILIAPLEKVEETQKLLAKCMLCLKSVPNELKEQVVEAVGVENNNTTLKVELSKDFEELPTKQTYIPEV